jgi:hypothetical protein
MQPSNILALCIATLTILSIQFLIIASLAAHLLSRRNTANHTDAEEIPHRPWSLSDTSPRSDTSPEEVPIPQPLESNDNASSLYSNYSLPPRPQNPVPGERLVEYPSSDDSLPNHVAGGSDENRLEAERGVSRGQDCVLWKDR